MIKPVLILESSALAPAGLLGDRLGANGLDCRRIVVAEPGSVPLDPESYAAIVILGGPQSAWEDEACPALPRERELIRRVAETGVPFLGICLGAQIAAMALGGRAFVHEGGGEHGFYPVDVTEPGDPLFGSLPPPPPLMQAHFDTFSPPATATPVARSPDVDSQAFRFGPAQYAIQFHFEVDFGILDAWRRAFARSSHPVLVEQARTMAGEAAERLPAAMAWGRHVADRWAAMIRSGGGG